MKSGDVISGKYRLTQRIGAGAMGAVWEALNERTGRRVALKLLLNATPDHRIRLLREARACGRVHHKNVVDIYDVGSADDGTPYLVMELFTGETLEQRLRRLGPLEDHAAGNYWSDELHNPEHRIEKIGVLRSVRRI